MIMQVYMEIETSSNCISNTLMCNNFDRVFASTCTRVKFHGTTEGLDICEVEIDKSPKPLFVDLIDKNGQENWKVLCKDWKLFTRV